MTSRPHIVLSIFGRCGSLFLHSLFDGHRQLSSIPGIAPYATLSWFVREGHTIPGAASLVDQVTQRFCSTFNDAFLRRDAGLDRLGENADEALELSPAIFRHHFAAKIPDGCASVAALSSALHDAFDLAFSRQPRDRIFLELHTIVPGDSEAIHAGLRGARPLLLVRDPLDNVESCVNYLLARQPVQRNRLTKFYELVLGMLAFQAGPSFLGEQAIAVRFEDLKRHPEFTIRQLCNALELDFEPSLLESTYMGKRYHSAPTRRNPGISGFRQTSQSPGGYRLTDHDRRFFATLFAGLGDFMGYETPPRASTADVQTVLTRRALDVEVAIAQAIGMDLQTLCNQQDLVGFRYQLAKLVTASGAGVFGLRCKPLARLES